MSELEAFEGHEALASATADVIEGALLEGVMTRGWASFAGAGGSTPAPVYRELSSRALPWAKIGVTLVDDRFVDPASPESNQRLFSETLLTGEARKAAFTPMWSDVETPDAAAEAVEADVEALMPFDAVLLGMGEDGHFASLFPGNPALTIGLAEDADATVIGAPAGPPAPPQPRITLTFSAILKSKLIVLLITGEAKRAVLERGRTDPSLPIYALLNQSRTPTRILWAA